MQDGQNEVERASFVYVSLMVEKKFSVFVCVLKIYESESAVIQERIGCQTENWCAREAMKNSLKN